jgi:glycosyltransferase involved in cell wall biosynthesis
MTRIAFHSENGPGVGGSDVMMGIVCDKLNRVEWEPYALVRPEYPLDAIFHKRPPVRLGDVVSANASQAVSPPNEPQAEASRRRSLGSPVVLVNRVVSGCTPSSLRRLLGYRRCATRVRQFLEANSVAVFQTMDAGAQPTVFGARQAGCGVVAVYCAPPPDGPSDWLSRLVARRSFRAAQVRVGLSQRNNSLWAAYLGVSAGDFRLIYNGVDVADFADDSWAVRAELGIPLGAVVVGMTGRMNTEKGPLVLARAAVTVARAYPEVLFVFTGGGDQLPDVERVFREAGLSDRVRLLGYRADAPRLAAAYDIAVVPSIFPEPFGLVVIEAMAWAKPVIGSRVGGIPEIVIDGQTGTLVEPNDSAALARAISDLLAAPSRRIAMGQVGFERVRQHFSRKRMVAAYVEVYRELLARRNPGL